MGYFLKFWYLKQIIPLSPACMLSHFILSDSLRPLGLQPTRLLCSRDFPGKNTGVGCDALLQGIFLTQRSNQCLLHFLHCQQVLYHKRHPGSSNCLLTFIIYGEKLLNSYFCIPASSIFFVFFWLLPEFSLYYWFLIYIFIMFLCFLVCGYVCILLEVHLAPQIIQFSVLIKMEILGVLHFEIFFGVTL